LREYTLQLATVQVSQEPGPVSEFINYSALQTSSAVWLPAFLSKIGEVNVTEDAGNEVP